MIGFRVDANEQIATGHLMRCIAIALQCKEQGKECIFFLAEKKETEKLEKKGIPYQILGTDWENMDSEREILKEMVCRYSLEWLVVDSYKATSEYLAFMEKIVPVLYIDDLEKEVYNVSALVHYGQWEDERGYQEKYANSFTKVFAGFRYIPLREEFAKPSFHKRKKQILITTGGTDPLDISRRFVERALQCEMLEEYQFKVVLGSLYSKEEAFMNFAEQNSRVTVCKNVSNMSKLMLESELAVSAGGTTLFELCACRVPTVCFSFADNQKEFAKEMGERKILKYVGDARVVPLIENDIIRMLCDYIQDVKMAEEYAKNMGEIVDGLGSIRIAEILTKW